MSSGSSHICALDEEGAIHCFGDDTYDQISTAPTNTGYRQIASAQQRSCALDTYGFVDCWGTELTSYY